MDYSQAIEYIEHLKLIEQKRPTSPSLERIAAFFSYYNSPQNSFTAFHIAGTNGKGSTTAMVDSCLRQSNLKIGRFIGPHLLRYNERFHIDGSPIADQDLASAVSILKAKSESFSALSPQYGKLSWFEFLVALAFFYFTENNIDIAAIEVGLGGRFDTTNVLQNLSATAITNIALDHESILGLDLQTIAMEKAGIIKKGIPIITAASEPALTVISKRAQEMNAPLTVCSGDSNKTNDFSELAIQLKKITNNITRHGIYQYQNALVALNMLKVADLLSFNQSKNKISFDQALLGINNFYWPGRFQIIESEHIVLDGAHNPAGAKALRESLDALFPKQSFHFIFACYADKDGSSMLRNLLRSGDNLYLVNLSGKRAFFSPKELAKLAQENSIKTSVHDSVADAIDAARKNRSKDDFIIASGSFLVIKATMQTLGWKSVEDGLN